jgi:hypothetical protein
MFQPVNIPNISIQDFIAIPSDVDGKIVHIRYSYARQCLEWKPVESLSWNAFGCVDQSDQVCKIGGMEFNSQTPDYFIVGGGTRFDNNVMDSQFSSIGGSYFNKTSCVVIDFNQFSTKPEVDSSVCSIYSVYDFTNSNNYIGGLSFKKYEPNQQYDFIFGGNNFESTPCIQVFEFPSTELIEHIATQPILFCSTNVGFNNLDDVSFVIIPSNYNNETSLYNLGGLSFSEHECISIV